MNNPYLTLKLDFGATLAHIEQAYDELQQEYHLAFERGSKVYAKLMLDDITAAYRLLSHTESRQAYDSAYKDQLIQHYNLQLSTKRSYEDWVTIESSYPEVRLLETILKMISPNLSLAFRSELLHSREYLRVTNLVKSMGIEANLAAPTLATALTAAKIPTPASKRARLNFKPLFWGTNLFWLVLIAAFSLAS
ncbi:MAG: DnaJ domain-containing protein [Shewanella sp.]